MHQEHNLRHIKNILTEFQRRKDKECAQISPISKELSNANLIRKNLENMRLLAESLLSASIPTEKTDLILRLNVEANIINDIIAQNGFDANHDLEFGVQLIQVNSVNTFVDGIVDLIVHNNNELIAAVMGSGSYQHNRRA